MGGSGLIATRLGTELANRGYEVHFLFYRKPFFLTQDKIPENAHLHILEQPSYALFKDIGAPYTIQAASKLTDIIRTYNIDILNSHYAIPHAVSSYLASKMTNVKTVVSTHGSDVHSLGKDTSYRETLALALSETDQVTSVSNFLARETESVFGLHPNSVKVIYDFVDTDEFKPLEAERKLNIIQASNFRPVKQIPYMIEIFAEVVKNFPEWKLDLVGNGPDWPLCMRKVRQLKVRQNVNFLNVRKDVPTLIANSSILASTSSIESFGLTLAEGMSCETPIWAPSVGGIPEVVEPGVTGELYDIGSKDDAINSLSKLMEDKAYRQKLGKNGRNYIKEHFSYEKIIKEYEILFQSLLNSSIQKPLLN